LKPLECVGIADVVHSKSVIFFYTELHFENTFSLNSARITYDLTSSYYGILIGVLFII
jgi:hypothetical protein